MTGRAAVIGAGSWGTALAQVLAGKGVPTILWSHTADVAEGIRRDQRNPLYLSEIALDPRLRVTTEIGEAVAGAEIVVSASPSHVVREVMARAAPFLDADAVVVSASKGIELDTLRTMDEVLSEVVPGVALAFLSGPSFALEVGQGLPTAVTVAASDAETARRAQLAFQTDRFRVYTNSDVRGTELGGALKNVIAIAAGVADGLGLGHNTRAALITRGLAEISRLGTALGADPLTFAGLAGMGDLILTCTGSLSRNRTVGMELGRGRSLAEVLGEMTMVAEGVRTARAARDLAIRTGVEMPITEQVHAVLYGGCSPAAAMEALMVRQPRAEMWR